MTLSPSELKQSLRAEARRRRNERSAQDAARQSDEIVRVVVVSRSYQRSASVALFWPILEKGEVDLRPLDAHARQDGKAVYYPWVSRDGQSDMGFRRVHELGALIPGPYGTREPPPTEPAAEPGEVDLIIVPALVATPGGHRLGYGGGYYDRLLARFAPPAHSIVVVFPGEVSDVLPIEAHDRTCDELVTGAPPFRG